MVVENARLHNSLSRGNYVMVKKGPLVLAITVVRPQLCSRNNSWPARLAQMNIPFPSRGAVRSAAVTERTVTALRRPRRRLKCTFYSSAT